MRFGRLRKDSAMRSNLTAMLGAATFMVLVAPAVASAGVTSVAVPANQVATDSGVSVTNGTEAVVTASGMWDVCGGGCPSGPNGATNGDAGFCPGVAGQPAGELLGSQDGGATFFDVGSGPTVVSTTGELYLGPNDCGFYGDNTGSLTAQVDLVPTSKAACKNGGWQELTDNNGTAFKNQGDCVSYVATGGKNAAG
jgi:hypothetical protein